MHQLRAFLLLLALSTGVSSIGQCNVTVTSLVTDLTCGGSGQFWIVGQANWSGGTPPYSLTASCGQWYDQYTNIASASAVFYIDLTFVTPPTTISSPVYITITDAMCCSSPLTATTILTGPSSVHPWTFNSSWYTFTAQVNTQDCTASSHDVALIDNLNTPASPFTSNLTAGHYSLTRNGAIVASGTLQSVYQASPERLFFPALLPGYYLLNYQLSPLLYQIYCPEQNVISFFVPNAGDCNTNVSLRAALQGALPSGTLMTDNLRAAGVLPLTEPYSTLGYSYTGSPAGATISSSLLSVTGNDAVVDWVVVELRNATTPAQVVSSKPALLQRDGDVMDTDGDAYVSFPVAPGNYHVAIRHRNHLGVMTSTAQALNVVPVTVDFRSSGTVCYGTSARAQVGSVYCLWNGDSNGNGTVSYTGSINDRDPIIVALGGNAPNSTLSNVYDRRDTNLDGVIRYTGTTNDRDVILSNIGGTVPTNTRTQQLP